MADNQVQIGVVFNIQGVENFEQVEKELQAALGKIGGSGGGLDIGFDQKSLKAFKKLIDQFVSAINDFKMAMSSTKLKVEIEDGDIQKLKTAIEKGLQEALSKIRPTIAKAAASTARAQKASSNAPKSPSRSRSTAGVFGEKDIDGNPDFSKNVDLQKFAKELEGEFEQLEKLTRTLTAEQAQQIAKVVKRLGVQTFDGFASFTREASKKITDDLALVQRAALTKLQEVQAEATKLTAIANDSTTDGRQQAVARQTAEGLVNQFVPALKAVISETEVLRRSLKAKDDVAKQSLKIDERLAERQKDLANFSGAAAKGVTKLTDSFEPQVVAQSVRQFSRLGDKINNDIKILQTFIDLNERFKSTARERLANFESQNISPQQLSAVSGIKDPESRALAASGDLTSSQREEYIELAKSVAFYEDTIDKALIKQNQFAKEGVKIKNVTSAFREFSKVKTNLNQVNSEYQRFAGLLSGSGDEARQGAQGLLAIGNAATLSSQKASRLINELELISKEEGFLTAQQGKLLDSLRKMKAELDNVSNNVRKNKKEFNDLIARVDKAGKQFQLYNEDLGKSIVQQFKFINALTIVSSVLFGLRTAFFELVEESRALARVYTVMQSASKNFVEIQKEVQKQVREVAIEFGETIEVTAEVVKQFGSAGFSTETALAALRSTMKLVVATQADAEASTRTIAGIYRVFGKDIRGTGNDLSAFAKINDVLISVYRNHQVELDELNQGFKFSAAAANAAGFSFNDTAAFLSVLNDNLIKSGTAGRGLQVIFAQLANKTEQFGRAFNIEIDKDSPLNDQFVNLLREINKDMSRGALTVAELEKQFKVFGLRGARSFITLVKQFDQVEVALNQLGDEADGTADKLSGIVKNSLAKQVESAKQALLSLARGAVEPLTDILAASSIVLQGLAEIINDWDSANMVFSLGLIAAGVVVVTQTILALVRILIAFFDTLTQLNTSMFSVTSQLELLTGAEEQLAASTAKTTGVTANQSAVLNASSGTMAKAATSTKGLAFSHAQVAAAVANSTRETVKQTAVNAAAATSVDKVAKAQKGAAAASALFVSSIRTLAGPVGLVITLAVTLLTAAGAFAAYSGSTRKATKDLEELGVQIDDVQDSSKKLMKFTEDLAEVDRLLSTTSINTEVAGQKIVEAYNQVGSNLVSDAAIITKTNAELVESFAEIRGEAEALARTKIGLNETSLKNLRLEIEAINDRQLLSKLGIEDLDVNTLGGLSNLQDDPELFNTLSTEIVSARQELVKLDRILAKNPSTTLVDNRAEAVRARELRGRLEFDTYQFDNLKSAQRIIDNFNALIDESIGRFGSLEAANESLSRSLLSLDSSSDKGTRALGRYLRRVLEARKTRIQSGGFNLSNPEDGDILNRTVGPFREIVELTKAPFDQGVFDGVLESLIEISDETKVVRQSFVDVNRAIELSLNPVKFNEVQSSIFSLSGAVMELGGILTESFDLDIVNKAGMELINFSDGIEKAKSAARADNSELDNLLGQDITFSTDIFTDNIVKALQQVSPEDRMRIVDNLNNLVPEDARIDLGKVGVDIDRGAVKELVENLFGNDAFFVEAADGFTDVNTTVGRTVAVVKQFTEALGLSAEEAQKLINNISSDSQTRMLEKATVHYEKLVDNMTSALFALNNFNDIGALRAQRTQIQQLFDARSQGTNKDLESIKAAYVQTFTDIAKIDLINGGELSDDDKARRDLLKEQGEEYRSQLQLLADINRINKQIRDKLTSSAVSLRKTNRQVEITSKNYKSSNALLFEQVETQSKFLILKIQEDRELEKINGRYDESLAALQSYAESLNQILELQNKIRDSIFDQAQERLSLLEIAAKVAEHGEDLAGVEFKILQLTNRIANATERLNRIKGDDTTATAERLKQQREILESHLELLDVFDKIKDDQEKINKLTDDRLSLVKKIQGVLGGQEGELAEDLTEVIERNFKADKVGTSSLLARALGLDQNQVLEDSERAIELFVNAAKEGAVDTGVFGSQVGRLGEELFKVSRAQNEYARSIESISLGEFERGVREVQELISSGDFEQASSLLSDISQKSEDAFKFDPRGLEQALKLQLNLRNQIVEGSGNANQIKLDVVTGPSFDVIRDIIKERNLEIRLDLLNGTNLDDQTFESLTKVLSGKSTVTEIGFFTSDVELAKFNEQFEQLNEAVRLIKGQFDENVISAEKLKNKFGDLTQTGDEFDTILGRVGSSLTEFDKRLKTVRITNPTGFNRGGFVGGSGSGDIVPAMLEPGEFVMTKAIVDKLGVGFFQTLLSGRIPGFISGGQVGAAIAGAKSKIGVASTIAGVGGNVAVLAAPNMETFLSVISTAQKETSEYTSSLLDTLSGFVKDYRDSKAKGLSEVDKLERDRRLAQAAIDRSRATTPAFEAIAAKTGDAVAKALKEDAATRRIGINKGQPSLARDLEEDIDDLLATFRNFPAEREAALELGNELREALTGVDIASTLIGEALSRSRTMMVEFLTGFMVPEFARANAEIYNGFIAQIREINIAYSDSVDESIKGIQRNETSYLSYLNNIEDAENERIKARLAAEQEYREQLLKTEDVFRDKIGESSDKIFDSLNDRISSITETVNNRLFGDIQDNLSLLVKSLTTGLNEAIPGLTKFFVEGESLVSQIGGSFTEFFQDAGGKLFKDGGKVQDFLGGFEGDGALLSLIGSSALGAIGTLIGPVVTGLQKLISFSLDSSNVENTEKFLEKFANDLESGGETFIDEVVGNAERLIDAISEFIPRIVGPLAELLPVVVDRLLTALEKAAPKLIDAIFGKLPDIVGVVVPAIFRLISILIDSLPTIITALAQSLPVFYIEVLKALFTTDLIPTIFKSAGRLILEIIPAIIEGFTGREIRRRRVFHDGGVVPGQGDVPILAQGGEGVLSLDGMRALGGLSVLNSLNRGKNPFLSLGDLRTVGSTGSRSLTTAPSSVISSGSGSDGFLNFSPNITLQISGSLGTSDSEIKRQAATLVDEMEKEMSRRILNRNSKLKKALDRRS